MTATAKPLPALTLRSVTSTAVEVPLRYVLGTSAATVRAAPLLLIDVQTEQGLVGRSYIFCYRVSGARAVAAVLQEAAGMIAGAAVAPMVTAATLERRYALIGVTGVVRMALSALDIDGVGDLHFPLHASMLDDASQSMMVSFRPHSLRVEVADAARDARFVWMPGTVEASEFLGEFTRYRVRVGAHNLAVDQAHHAGLNKFPVGSAVNLGLEPSQVRLFAG